MGIGKGMVRILLVEDDPSMRGFLARALTKAGHLVVAVPNGDEAVTRLAESAYDLLLADIVMPGVDGVDLAKRVNAETLEVKVMLITGFAAVELKAKSVLDPSARVLSKPFHLRAIVDEVDKLLAA